MPSLPSCNHPRLSPVSYQILEKREQDTHPQIYERKDFWDQGSLFFRQIVSKSMIYL